jgi:hypothetical protein
MNARGLYRFFAIEKSLYARNGTFFDCGIRALFYESAGIAAIEEPNTSRPILFLAMYGDVL